MNAIYIVILKLHLDDVIETLGRLTHNLLNNMIRYNKGISKRQSFSEVKMDRSSICKNLSQPFQNTPRHKVVKTWNIQSFILHNIIEKHNKTRKKTKL